MELQDYEYITPADTAKLIRVQLKTNFPGVKFTVKTSTYSGGASIDISWIDGPTKESVRSITHPFSGSGFDGMTDYKTSNSAWLLPDGSAIFAEIERYSEGENIVTEKPLGARLVSFGADYIFEDRQYSPAKAKPIIKAVCSNWGKQEPQYYEYETKQGLIIDWNCCDSVFGADDHNIGIEIHQALNVAL